MATRVCKAGLQDRGPAARLVPASLQRSSSFGASTIERVPIERAVRATTTIDGLRIHFLHARSPRPNGFPLILTHGWPGSVIEYLDVLPLLTEAGFHCVVPSLPGYGFSGKPTKPGWGVTRIAGAWSAASCSLDR